MSDWRENRRLKLKGRESNERGRRESMRRGREKLSGNASVG